MYLSEINVDHLSRRQITHLIYDGMTDDGADGDCIFVFGSKSINRVKKAAELFHEKRAPLILISGSSMRWGEGKVSEAHWMRDYLISFGVPEKIYYLKMKHLIRLRTFLHQL